MPANQLLFSFPTLAALRTLPRISPEVSVYYLATGDYLHKTTETLEALLVGKCVYQVILECIEKLPPTPISKT